MMDVRLDLSANSDDIVQVSDIEKLITNKVDVMVIVPHDGKAMAKGLAMAHEAGIPVITWPSVVTKKRRWCRLTIVGLCRNVSSADRVPTIRQHWERKSPRAGEGSRVEVD